jgi:DNA-binding MarR family transcriptional regulator
MWAAVSDHDLERAGSELVTYAARLVRAIRRDLEQPAGLRVLSILDEQGPLGITALAEVDRCSQPTMSGTVAALAERGWVSKFPHPEDARSSLVQLTAAGRSTLAAFRHDTGAAVAARLAAHHHTLDDVTRAVTVLRDVLNTPREGSL